MRDYSESIELLTADYSLTEALDEPAGASEFVERTETGVVPGADYNYTVILDERIADYTSLVVTVGGVEMAIIPFADAPGDTQAAVAEELPLVRLHADNAGAAISVTYMGAGTIASAMDVNQLRVNDADLNTRLIGVNATAPRILHLPGIIGSSASAIASIYLDGNGRTSLTVRKVWLTGNLATTLGAGTTELYLTTAETPTGGAAAPVLAYNVAKVAGTVALVIDVTTAAWLNIFCTASAEHADITIGIEFE